MKRRIFIVAVLSAAAVLPFVFIASYVTAAVIAIAAFCLILWLSESAPPFVPTLLLWAMVPVFLSPFDPKYSLAAVLGWAADPVLALFFGGFVLGIATERHGIDRRLSLWAFRGAGASFDRLLLTTIVLTAFLSMWISNIAAAALMLACTRSSFSLLREDDVLRRTLLVGVALGANLGGIATPIGTGPNAIAIASMPAADRVTFVEWMAFAVPLTVGMLLLGFFLLRWRMGSADPGWASIAKQATKALDDSSESVHSRTGEIGFLAVLLTVALLWLTEPLHGVPSAVVSIAGAAVVFLSRLLKRDDIARIDWSTLVLIAGGITLGRLLETSGVVAAAAAAVPFDSFHPTLALFVICFASALLSALMSNTATAVMLIPLATALMPGASTAILIALAASFGMPFVISTPPNAMAFGEGGMRTADILVPGLIIMILGCALISLTGRIVLNFAGVQ